MNEASKTCTLSTLPDTPNAISSQGLVAGATPRALPDGRILAPSGQVLAPASLSARQAKEAGCLMSGTYGQPSSISSNSLDLTLSLESRLQARLDSRGSTLFKLTWKRRTTPQQRSIFALRASGLRTSVSVYSGVPTPCGQDGPKGGPGQGTDRLPGAAALASVPTPTLHDAERGGQAKRAIGEDRHGSNLQDFALPAHCISPQASDANGAGANQNTASLDLQVRLAAAATPSARDYKSNSSTEEFQLQQWTHPRGEAFVRAGYTRGFWKGCDWWHGRDEKFRPIEPRVQPLATGVSKRVGKLRGYGNSIVPEIAAEFIASYMECCPWLNENLRLFDFFS